MFVFLCFLIFFAYPASVFIVAPVLIISGYIVYEQSTDNITRAIAIGAIVGGIFAAVIFIFTMISSISYVETFSHAKIVANSG